MSERAGWRAWMIAAVLAVGVTPGVAQAQQDGAKAVELAAASPRFRVVTTLSARRGDAAREARRAWVGALGAQQLARPLSAEAASAVDEGEWERAVAALVAMRPDAAKEPYLTFLLAYAQSQAGLHADALKTLDRLSLKRVTLLADYVALVRAESAFAQGDFKATAEAAARVPSNSPARQKSVFLRAEALSRASDKDRTIARAALDDAVRLYPNASQTPGVAVQLAAEYAAAKMWSDSARVADQVLRQHPLSKEASTAQKQLATSTKKLKKDERLKVEAGWFDRVMARQRALYAAHQSETLVKEAAKLLKKNKKSSKLFVAGEVSRCELEYLIARSYTKLRKHKDSLPWYTSVIKTCKDTTYVRRALYHGGRGAWNGEKPKLALEWFGKLAVSYATHSIADDAMHYQARILREQGKLKDARAKLQAQVKQHPDGDMAKDAHWLLVRELFARKKYAEIVKHVASIKNPGEDDVYSQGRLAYFAARAQELRGKKRDAATRYEAIARANPMGYYALLSLNRLAGMRLKKGAKASGDLCKLDKKRFCVERLGDAVAPSAARPEVPEALRADETFQRGVLLLSMKLDSLADREFGKLRYRYRSQPETLWALATLLDATGSYPRSHDIPRRILKGWQTRYPADSADARWSVAYPTPFAADVRKWAKARKLPDALVWAIMREESGFRPRIESWANARGLLQLIAPTAKGVARSEKLKDYSFDKLFEPATNIQLGTAYMRDLADRFEDQIPLIIAGYNGGHANIDRWLGERGELPLDLWVEDIPYGQTRKYTKRVLTSYWAYSWLYGAERVPAVSFELPKKKGE